MRIHDWASVPPLIYRGFHIGWLSQTAQALSAGVLPPEHYATIWSDQFAEGVDRSEWLQNHVVVWSPAHRIIAAVALLMPDPEGHRSTDAAFIVKAVRDIGRGRNLLVVDLFPSDTSIHSAIWEELTGHTYSPPADKPLTIVSYTAGDSPAAYLETLAVGDRLTDMPLFLTPDQYVPVPLESSYQTEFSVFPTRWRQVLEG